MIKSQMRAEIDDILKELDKLKIRLNRISSQLRNRPPRTHGAAVSAPMDANIRAQIRAIHRSRPDLPQHVIARMVGVNPGRVSETLAGKRT